MTPRRRLGIAAVAAAGVGLVALAIGLAARDRGDGARCGPGFTAVGPRCTGCAPPLVTTPGGCAAPDVRVTIPETTVLVGPSDWEAEGRVPARTLHVPTFRIDAFEVTADAWGPRTEGEPRVRAASGMTRDEASAYCARRGGHLPTEDEWIAAATAPSAGNARRYPWGDTGAVCRRAAWGLAAGPCARGGTGPDLVGAHPDGDTPLGVHDLAGNVAEWVAADPAAPGRGVARGGSWASALATELRTWARWEVPPETRDGRIGFRCAYGAP